MAEYERLVDTIASVDAINVELAHRVAAHIATYGDDPLPLTRARQIMFEIDRELARAYGPTRVRASRAQIFQAIVSGTDLTSEDAYLATLRDLSRNMQQVDPNRWNIIERALRDGGLGPDDRLAQAYMSLGGPSSQRERFLRSGMLDPQRRWVKPGGYRLSDRVWANGRLIRKRIDQTLRAGMLNGKGPVTIARELERYLSPEYSPITYGRNKQVLRRRVARRGDGAGANRARVLARTELQHMHMAATTDSVDAIDIQGGGVEWALSAAHPEIDICDDLARANPDGLGRGVYKPENFPEVPHPNCLCSARPVMPSRENVLNQLWERYGS